MTSKDKQERTLESHIRKISQPRCGYVHLADMHARVGDRGRVEIKTDFSRMLLSRVVRHIAAYAVFMSTYADNALLPPLTRIRGDIEQISSMETRKKEVGRVDALVNRIHDDPVSKDGICAWCELLTFAPLSAGGSRALPDGGRIVPDKQDILLIRELAHRSARFLCSDDSDELYFEHELEISGSIREFTSASVNFLSGKGAYKIAPLTKLPQPRDTLLVCAQAMLASVDVFGIYNPVWDVFHWSRISDIPADRRKEIKQVVFGR